MKKIHHLGIACKDIKDLLNALDITQEEIKEVHEDVEQRNMLYFISLEDNDLWIECVVPIDNRSTTWNFVNRNGIGLHHIGIESFNLKGERENMLQKKGAFEIASFQLNINSFGGAIKTLFFTVKGLIIEYVYNNQKNNKAKKTA